MLGRFHSIEPTGAAACAAVPVIALGFADGGFYQRPWGWATMGLGLTVVAVLVLRREPAISRRALLLIGLLVALGIWIAASLAWTRSVGLTVEELQRLLVYVAAVAAAALLVRSNTTRALLAGVFAGTASVAVVGLVSYLLTREQAIDLFQGASLHRPMGYANAMGITCVVAMLLALGFAVDGRSPLVRTGAAVALVPLVSALALTESRASWAAFLIGTAITLSVTPCRMRAGAHRAALLAVPALAAFVVSQAGATSTEVVGERADRLGERLLVLVVALTALAVGPALIASRREPAHGRLQVGRGPAIVVVALVVAPAVLAAATQVRGLGSDRARFWAVAAEEFRERPLLGSGAGTYGQLWLERRPVASFTHDAHSLPVETLAELGVVGLALVCLLLVAPLLWALRARGRPLVPAAAGALAAYAVHASVDWDWEMPAVTLAGLLCAVALAIAADGDARPIAVAPAMRGVGVGVATVIAAVGLAGFVGASALEDGTRALARGDNTAAEASARRAELWRPWSSDASLTRGQALLALGDRSAARRAFRRAAKRDPNDYRAWLALAGLSEGEAASAALLRAAALNPIAVRTP